MKGQSLVDSFRDLCQKLHLKAESQEIDRIIEAFSQRYYDCNPDAVYGSPGVVHTVTGAMLMLNTDLHIADLTKHMSRADFVRNAMRAIQESSVEDKSWEAEAENALRVGENLTRLMQEIYTSVRADRILLGEATPNKRQSVLRTNTARSASRTMKRGSVFGSSSLMVDGLSPTPSYATSINEAGGYNPIGFASNLSHSVIREHDERSISSHRSADTVDELDVDQLALLGAPWAKEGLLQRKLYNEAPNKRAKKNEWKQLFVVIQKGELMMFVFGQGSGSSGGNVGGGNWMVGQVVTALI